MVDREGSPLVVRLPAANAPQMLPPVMIPPSLAPKGIPAVDSSAGSSSTSTRPTTRRSSVAAYAPLASPHVSPAAALTPRSDSVASDRWSNAHSPARWAFVGSAYAMSGELVWSRARYTGPGP